MQAVLLLVTNDYLGLIVIECGQCTTECGHVYYRFWVGLLLNLDWSDGWICEGDDSIREDDNDSWIPIDIA